jgi:hypothetical protein
MMMVAAARAAAEQLGLLAAVETPRSAGELAAELGVGARRLGWLLDLLACAGTLSRDGTLRYRRADRAPVPPARGAGLLAAVLRRDAPLTLAESLGSVEAAVLTCHDAIVRVPPALVARLADLAGDGVLLDAGCGDAAIAEAVLARNPRARAVLVDRDVRHAVRLRGARATLVASDLARAALPPARVALVSNVVHNLAPDAAEKVVAHVAAAVEPGGALVVREVGLADDRSGPRFGLAFGLSLTVFDAGAELVETARIAAWMAAAGLAPAPPEALGESVLLVGTRQAR